MAARARYQSTAGAMEPCCGAKLDDRGHKDCVMLIIGIAGGVLALLFLGAVMTGIEGTEYR
jgi:hypothetical protein